MSSDTSGRRWGDTTSASGEKARIFIGNTDPKKTKSTDLERIFSAHGAIKGIDVNGNGFAFVQFATPEEANRAVNAENGTLLYGKKLDIRIFDKSNIRKKPDGGGGGGRGRDRSRSPLGRRGPPPMHHGNGPPPRDYYDQSMPPHGPPNQPVPTNDIEIIIFNKDQWPYGEMIEKKLRHETGIQFIDLLFLHSPQHIQMTLRDLYERRTLYAIVIAPMNEENGTITVHILHSQRELRDLPVDEAISVIGRDHRAFTGAGDRNGPGGGGPPMPPVDPFHPNSRDNGNYPTALDSARSYGGSGGGGGVGMGAPPSFGSANGSAGPASNSGLDKRLPEEIAYVLRTALNEGGCQFLSLHQIDMCIDFFSKERERLTTQARSQVNQPPSQPGPYGQSPAAGYDGYQSSGPMPAGASSGPVASVSHILDNPQFKAAIGSLLGTISSQAGSNGALKRDAPPQAVEAPSYNTSGYGQYHSGPPSQLRLPGALEFGNNPGRF